jgi:sorbitol-specific phosphotransferase system component IIBC
VRVPVGLAVGACVAVNEAVGDGECDAVAVGERVAEAVTDHVAVGEWLGA